MLTGHLRRGPGRRSAKAQLCLCVAVAAALAAGEGRAGTTFSACGVGPYDTFVAPDGAAGDRFGSSVAVGANTFVAGAPYDDAPEAERGSASVYSYDTVNGWQFAKKLVAPGGGITDLFGWSVSLSGDFIVVGALHEDDAGVSSGAAYVFSRNLGGAGNWGFVKKLLAGDAAAGDQFGYSVAVDGDVAVVGAWNDAAPESARGSAYVYVRNAGGADNWGFVKKLLAPDGVAGTTFGVSVALDAGVAVVGASFEGESFSGIGAAYLFGRNTGGAENWGFIKKLTAPDGAVADFFGGSVAIGDGAIVIGARMDDDLGNASGSAYVYMRNAGGAGNWGFVKKLLDDINGAAGDQFGSSVAVDQGIAVVGAPLNWSGVGAGRLFTRDAGGRDNWGFARNIFTSNEIGDRFGSAVAISGGWALVGATLDDDATHGADCGSATPFENPETVLLTLADCDNDNRPDLLQLRLGFITDCNDNGRPDSCDIASGDSLDANMNGIPDECEGPIPCPSDINRSGVVNSTDLSILLGSWGPCP